MKIELHRFTRPRSYTGNTAISLNWVNKLLFAKQLIFLIFRYARDTSQELNPTRRGGLFRAKMSTFGIQNPKLIVSNDYQQFLTHFDWFLTLFQISDVKTELLPVELKVCKNGIFWAKNLFQKNFPRLFLSPNQSYVKKLGQKGL